jgi:hypothetical protein
MTLSQFASNQERLTTGQQSNLGSIDLDLNQIHDRRLRGLLKTQLTSFTQNIADRFGPLRALDPASVLQACEKAQNRLLLIRPDHPETSDIQNRLLSQGTKYSAPILHSAAV